MLAEAGCPVDRRLPAGPGANGGELQGLQQSTLEAWFTRLAAREWLLAQIYDIESLTEDLLEYAAQQGSKGRPELLAAAAATGCDSLIKLALEALPPEDSPAGATARADLESRRRAGRALLSAARKGRTSAIPSLLARGAHVDFIAADHCTPLMAAAECGQAEAIQVRLDCLVSRRDTPRFIKLFGLGK